MDDRKWKDLPIDCLVEIFSRVGLKSLIDWVPYVCKSWHKATLSPQCWQNLILNGDLPCLINLTPRSLKYFINFLIRRSHGTVNEVVYSERLILTEEVLNCIAEGCPLLKRLALPSYNCGCFLILPNMICKWKDLEALEIFTPCLLENIIPQIGLHCKKFKSLSAIGDVISRAAALSIATLLQNIEFLSFRSSIIKRGDLVVILKGCRKLVNLDVSHCVGFVVDDEILNLAAHLATFNFEGSREMGYDILKRISIEQISKTVMENMDQETLFDFLEEEEEETFYEDEDNGIFVVDQDTIQNSAYEEAEETVTPVDLSSSEIHDVKVEEPHKEEALGERPFY